MGDEGVDSSIPFDSEVNCNKSRWVNSRRRRNPRSVEIDGGDGDGDGDGVEDSLGVEESLGIEDSLSTEYSLVEVTPLPSLQICSADKDCWNQCVAEVDQWDKERVERLNQIDEKLRILISLSKKLP